MGIRFFTSMIAALILAAVLTAPATAADSNVFLKATAGGSYPFMSNLNNELKAQGRCELSPGLSFSMSIGRAFSQHKWALELWFDFARYQSFTYENDYESFEGEMTHYNFMLVGKMSLWPSNEIFRPYLGAGFGYGYTNIARAGGKIDGLQGMLIFQVESRIKDYLTLFMETSFLSTFDSSKYDSSFLESSNYDAIFDSNGDPLNERFSSIDLRIGIQAWLKPPSKYGD
jgi:opacity protein-like surface antigen